MGHRPSMESYAAAMSPQSRRPFPGYLLAFILLAILLAGPGRDVAATGWTVLTGILDTLTLPDAPQ